MGHKTIHLFLANKPLQLYKAGKLKLQQASQIRENSGDVEPSHFSPPDGVATDH